MVCQAMRFWRNSRRERTGALNTDGGALCGFVPGHRQITTLEILAISVGLSTLQDLLKCRKVVVWTDNKGAEGAARGGSAKAWDHCRLIHEMWLHALQNGTHVWIERVPSHDNISDSPSR